MEEFGVIEKGIASARKIIGLLNGDNTNAVEYQNLFIEWNIINLVNEFEEILQRLEEKFKLIKEKIERKFINLYFFGKMSSGKSKIINGIIQKDLFSSLPEHTTNCFVHIEKSSETDYKILLDGAEVGRFDDFENARKEIEKLSTNKNGNDFNNEKFIKVFVPIDEDNKIMKENVKLIDSPGSGNRQQITASITEYAKDADIFVFVLMHDITEDDEKFFEFQTENSTKPDIFVLINKWDETDQDRVESLRQCENNLLMKCDKLITKMNENSVRNIRDRTYFISAKEIFDIRINKIQCFNNEKIKQRYENFERFELKLSEYIKNRERHKYQRYSQEINRIKKELSNEYQKFSTNISNKLGFYLVKINGENVDKCAKHIEEIKNKCNKIEEKCIENIKCKVTKMMNTINIDNPDEIKENIKKHYSSIDEDIIKLYVDLDERLSLIKENYVMNNNEGDDDVKKHDMSVDQHIQFIFQDSDENTGFSEESFAEKCAETNFDEETENYECYPVIKKDSLKESNEDKISRSMKNKKLSKLGRKDIKIKTDLENVTFPKSKAAVRILSLIPIVGFVATNILLSRIDNADEHNLNKNSLNDLEKEIHENDNLKIQNIKKSIRKIKNHFIGEIDKIVEKIKVKTECIQGLFNIFSQHGLLQQCFE